MSVGAFKYLDVASTRRAPILLPVGAHPSAPHEIEVTRFPSMPDDKDQFEREGAGALTAKATVDGRRSCSGLVSRGIMPTRAVSRISHLPQVPTDKREIIQLCHFLCQFLSTLNIIDVGELRRRRRFSWLTRQVVVV